MFEHLLALTFPKIVVKVWFRAPSKVANISPWGLIWFIMMLNGVLPTYKRRGDMIPEINDPKGLNWISPL